MQSETAKILTDAVMNATDIAIDNRNKLTALELLLQERDPNLFQDYLDALQKVRNNPPTSLVPAVFSKIQSMLAQD
jgi:hypothetical protein